VELVWGSVPDAWYQPQYRAGLDAEWIDLSPAIPSEGAETRARFHHPVAQQGFFRVRVTSEP
jgi:hypothetical protein